MLFFHTVFLLSVTYLHIHVWSQSLLGPFETRSRGTERDSVGFTKP